MSEKRTHSDYLQKAGMYDLLAQFYKYSSPDLHMLYYIKHLKYMNKAVNTMRTYTQQMQQEAKVRILHASPDAQDVDIYINGQRVMKGLPFKKVTNVLS